jgi:hypothetical protein
VGRIEEAVNLAVPSGQITMIRIACIQGFQQRPWTVLSGRIQGARPASLSATQNRLIKPVGTQPHPKKKKDKKTAPHHDREHYSSGPSIALPRSVGIPSNPEPITTVGTFCLYWVAVLGRE